MTIPDKKCSGRPGPGKKWGQTHDAESPKPASSESPPNSSIIIQTTKILEIMNEKNFEYLRDQVKYSGFGEGLENQLKENIKRQPPEFTLQHQATFGKDEVNSALHFKRSATTDMYFFNSYMASDETGTAGRENEPDFLCWQRQQHYFERRL
jgi:hypothetical protein